MSTYEIIEINDHDSFGTAKDRRTLIGLVGSFEFNSLTIPGFAAGQFTPDESLLSPAKIKRLGHMNLYFFAVKVIPVKVTQVTTEQPEQPEQPEQLTGPSKPTHEIVDIHPDDAYAQDKDRLLGLRGTLEPANISRDVPKGYQSVRFQTVPDSSGDSGYYVFFAVKLKALNELSPSAVEDPDKLKDK